MESKNPALFGYIFCLIYLIIGWMGANHIGNDWNRKNKNYSNLPIDVVDKKMCFRSPYIVSGLFLLMISSIFELIITIVVNLRKHFHKVAEKIKKSDFLK